MAGIEVSLMIYSLPILTIDALKHSFEQLTARLGHLEKTGAGNDLPDEKPPHY